MLAVAYFLGLVLGVWEATFTSRINNARTVASPDHNLLCIEFDIDHAPVVP